MNTFQSEPHLYNSPKRKRGEYAPGSRPYNPTTSPSAPLIVTDLRKFPFTQPDDDRGDGSPRTLVAGQFQTLAIENCSQLDGSDTGHHARKRFAQMSEVEVTETPSNTQRQFQPPSAGTFNFEAPAPPVIFERPQGGTCSPPLSGDRDNNYWHETEITGHDPDDSNDDGYGINGIGFKPTPAMAYARSQARKKQLAEYKSREAKEARQRRSERRKTSSENEAAAKGALDMKPARVRFEDG